MKEYMFCGTKIQAFRFNGNLDLDDDFGALPWFTLGYHNNDFCETLDSENPGRLKLTHCEPSMHVQDCHIGDWVAYDATRPDIGVFFIPAENFKQLARDISLGDDYNSLTAANIARQKEWDTGTEPLSLSFKGNELAGETGELCNVLKKLERERLGIPGSRDTVEHAAEEMADVIICVDLIATHLGVDLWEAVAKKFNATSEKNGMKTRLVIPNG